MFRPANDGYHGHMYAQIVAINHAVPNGIQTAEKLSPLIGRSAAWIREHAGVDRRFTSQVSDDPAKLVASIAKPIIEQWGQPDLVIHAGSMPRQLMPDTSVFVMRELGLSGVPGFTLNAACLSFLVAMRTATSFIADGMHRRVLICTSEFGTHARNFNQAESAALIGDGAAAMMLVATEQPVGICHKQKAGQRNELIWDATSDQKLPKRRPS
jgi:3-oxoacyl-[acyl-carrier-protein] synthase-3